MKKYVYAFDDNILENFSLLFKSRVGDSSGEYEEEYLDMVKLLLHIKKRGSLLDIGAGMGRLVSIAKDVINKIVALEPDKSR